MQNTVLTAYFYYLCSRKTALCALWYAGFVAHKHIITYYLTRMNQYETVFILTPVLSDEQMKRSVVPSMLKKRRLKQWQKHQKFVT